MTALSRFNCLLFILIVELDKVVASAVAEAIH